MMQDISENTQSQEQLFNDDHNHEDTLLVGAKLQADASGKFLRQKPAGYRFAPQAKYEGKYVKSKPPAIHTSTTQNAQKKNFAAFM